MKRKRTRSRSKSISKPIGYVKEGKSYKLVFGSKSKPRFSRKKYKTKALVLKKGRSLLKK